MFNTGLLIKQYLLSNSEITTTFGNKIFNLFVDFGDKINTPYLAIIIDSINPNYTKNLFIWNEIDFTIAVITNKYTDLTSLNKLIKSSLEFRSLEDSEIEINDIRFINYQEVAIEEKSLYTSLIQFNCKQTNKNI